MPWQARVYKILIASPSDLKAERKAIPEVIHEWNDLHADKYGVMLQAVMWEKQTVPEMGDRPQAIVNRQIVDKCDSLIGVFWTRLGTPTGVADSGTIEEIEKFLQAKKSVLLYFSSRRIPPEEINSEQYELLKKHKKKYEKQGIVWRYKSIPELRRQLENHLTLTAERLKHSLVINKNTSKPQNGIKETPTENLKSSKTETDASNTLPPLGKSAEGYDKKQEALIRFKSEFESFLSRFEIEWISERDSNPLGFDNSIGLVEKSRRKIDDFLDQAFELHLIQVATILKKSRQALDDIETDASPGYADDFWAAGDAALDYLKHIPELINNFLKQIKFKSFFDKY